MVFQQWFAEHQLIRAIDAIHGAELGINNGSLDLPPSWRPDYDGPSQSPPNWDTALAAEWPELPEGCTWWGRRIMYLKLLRMRREMCRLWLLASTYDAEAY